MLLAVAALLVGILFAFVHKTRQKAPPLPPGPKPLPLIGNLLDIPRENQSQVYASLARIYGEMVFLNVFGQKILVLHDPEDAVELFERRSLKYSDRPTTVMLHDLMDFGWILGFIPYGQRWRFMRRLLHEQLRAKAIEPYQSLQLRGTRRLLKELAKGPDNISFVVRRSFSIVATEVTYGLDESSDCDASTYILLAEEALHNLSQASVPGQFLVDMFTPLKYMPSWMPGASFKHFAAKSKQTNQELLDRPLEAVKTRLRTSGKVKPCIAIDMSTYAKEGAGGELSSTAELAVRDSLGAVYTGGVDTTVSAATCLFLAMCRYPSVLAKAHAELDLVVGQDQLPDFSHRADLPYIEAIMMELLRWQPVLPLGLCHKSTEDDVYKDYFIPKGTMVFPNVQKMMHDPHQWENPEDFIPERFLRTTASGKYEIDSSIRDPRSVVFGWGRRSCPGMHFAEQGLYAFVSNVLAAFDIKSPLNAMGQPEPPEVRMTLGLLAHPLPFKCVVKPRTKDYEELVEQPLPERD